ncbi:PAAR domain-containing protein [Xanthomonas sp. AmX2]|uniref:PAAR domain-containing protein n=1 Tax=Xanthomonas sp. TaxID=29446 RepID=UPI00197DA19D|nr:PAAR domain-containing protein [Xanthomonas sp.]MBN6152744.1 PAAR domain-containing protein [Xanthomonas sp.]
MARLFVVVGDALDGGGSVVSGSPFTDVDGRSVARIGDKAVCARHGMTVIATGDPTIVIDGQPVARQGDSCACGCKLISAQQGSAFVEQGPGRGSPSSEASGGTLSSGLAGTSGKPKNLPGDSSQYDEGLRFLSVSGKPLSGAHYRLQLDNGTSLEGTTNQAGETGRIETSTPAKITRAALKAGDAEACCSLQAQSEPDTHEFQIDGVITNNEDLGTSIVDVKAEGHERGLTQGEVEIARLVFNDSIDYSKVKIHNHGWWLFFGFQDKNTAVTPNGEMYFPGSHYKEDYSKESIAQQHWFLHEMTHVWQHQLGYSVILVRGPRPGMSYDYVPEVGKKLCDYNMEKQGNILADYFVSAFRGAPEESTIATSIAPANVLPALQSLLVDFFADPANKRNLPNTKK